MRRTIAILLALSMMISVIGALAIMPAAGAADAEQNAKYLTPTGAGTKDGSSWANAFEGDKANALTEAWDKTAENGTLYVGAGAYKVVQTLVMAKGGGSLDALKKMVGVNDGDKRPEFTGDYAKMSENDKGTNFISLNEGVKYIQVENIVINNYSYGVYTNGLNEGLRFYNLDMNYICDGFYLDGHSKSAAIKGNKDIIIDGSDIYWHRKRVVRFRGGNSDAIVSNCTGDAGGKEAWRKGNWPVGVAFESNDKDVFEERITVVDSTFKNCYQEADPATGYWNSDGVSGEKTSRDLTFIRVNSFSTTDGGWDLKTVNPILIDCVSMDNKRNFRFWAEEKATLINCLSAYSQNRGGSGGSTGLWTDAYVEAYNCTFFNNNSNQVQSDGGYITLNKCIVGYFDKKSSLYSGKNSMILNNVVEFDNKEPHFKKLSSELFYGNNDSWNNLDYNGAVGYHYSADKKTVAATEIKNIMDNVDVTATYAWAKDSIAFMAKEKFMKGYGVTYFGAADNTTRIDFALMLVRTLGLGASDKKADYPDLPKTYRFRDELGAAVDIGIIKGDDTGLFRPFDSMSREEMMAMLNRALKATGKFADAYAANPAGLDKFKDVGTISDWAKQEVANVVEKEIIKGNDDGNINPKGNTTRAETAVIGKRIFDLK